jgi:prepilin signal peptidase PulO-like enzyme (type II secretory pathway)
MGMVVTLFLALAAMTIGYAAFGQGGGVAGMVFFGVLLIGAAIRVLQSTMSGSDLR